MKRKGYETIYLGESIADKDLFTVLNIIKPSYLFMSCSLKENLGGTFKLVEALIKDFPDLKVGLGGAALSLISEEDRTAFSGVLMGDTQSKWEEWLKG